MEVELVEAEEALRPPAETVPREVVALVEGLLEVLLERTEPRLLVPVVELEVEVDEEVPLVLPVRTVPRLLPEVAGVVVVVVVPVLLPPVRTVPRLLPCVAGVPLVVVVDEVVLRAGMLPREGVVVVVPVVVEVEGRGVPLVVEVCWLPRRPPAVAAPLLLWAGIVPRTVLVAVGTDMLPPLAGVRPPPEGDTIWGTLVPGVHTSTGRGAGMPGRRS